MSPTQMVSLFLSPVGAPTSKRIPAYIRKSPQTGGVEEFQREMGPGRFEACITKVSYIKRAIWFLN